MDRNTINEAVTLSATLDWKKHIRKCFKLANGVRIANDF